MKNKKIKESIIMFLLSFALCVIVGEIYSRNGVVESWRGELNYQIKDKDDFYLAYYKETDIDHTAIRYNLSGAVPHIKSSDVIFMGSSCLQLGLNPESLNKYSEKSNIKFYSLGFGHGEHALFPLELFDKYDLAPKAVVVNADNFFRDKQSEYLKQLNQKGFWENYTVYNETNMSWFLDSRLHKLLPRFSQKPRIVIFRSRTNGGWSNVIVPNNQFKIKLPDENKIHIPKTDMDIAKIFKSEMDKRGTKLILMLVPHPTVSFYRARKIAEELEVPFIEVSADGLKTFDDKHLTLESSKVFCDRLFKSLLETPEIKEIIKINQE